jgi:Na+-translocating ferredoxin:NAD+ oxidoreductase RnfD subunit
MITEISYYGKSLQYKSPPVIPTISLLKTPGFSQGTLRSGRCWYLSPKQDSRFRKMSLSSSCKVCFSSWKKILQYMTQKSFNGKYAKIESFQRLIYSCSWEFISSSILLIAVLRALWRKIILLKLPSIFILTVIILTHGLVTLNLDYWYISQTNA